MTHLAIESRCQKARRASTPRCAPASAALAVSALVLILSGCRSRTTSAESSGPAMPSELARIPAGFESRFADVNGTRLHYLIGGVGKPVVLLHGFAQTSRMWHHLMSLLAIDHQVIVPDLRGAGESARPKAGYDKKNLAVDIHELTFALGIERVAVVGHDIGLMVAYAFAAQFPEDTERVVLMDAFLPGIGNWKEMWLMRDLWHFHFYGEVPLALVTGRERIYLEHFWNDFAADRYHSVPESDRQAYAHAFAQPGGVSAGFEYFRNFEQDARDFEALSARKLDMPVLVIAGEKSGSTFLADQVRLVALDVRGEVIARSGHWLMDEARDEVSPLILKFLQ